MAVEIRVPQLAESISEATVSRKWRAGKAWLANELGAA